MNLFSIAYRFILLFVLFFLAACGHSDRNKNWFTYIDNVGTYSSPRTADLTKDGVLDIIIGAGGKEEVYTDTAVIALDGATGKVLWALPGVNQFVGSAIFQDVDNDQVPDVFIGGRWAQLIAISGATGKTIWTFLPERSEPSGAASGWYNFSSAQLVPDQDKDGFQDLLIANGGDAHAMPNDPKRPAGRLMVLSSANGKILADAPVPDGMETYMSPISMSTQGDHNNAVFFGTGGETLGGRLYRTTLNDIMRGDISNATVLASSNKKGFIASPVLVDITQDNVHDVIVNTVDGRMLAIDGKTDKLIWELNFPGTEAYTIPAPGYFTGDSVPDLFANFAIGVFPNLQHSIRFMVDGKTGKLSYIDTIASFQYASPVAVDLNNDGFDEALVNQSAVKRKQFENVYYSYLLAFDFKNKKQFALGDTLLATNLASTPWVGDLDNDNKLDIVYNAVRYQDFRFDLRTPLGLMTKLFKTNVKMKRPIGWGAYMGSNHSCIFPSVTNTNTKE
jgi:hypothetical protein